MAIRTREDQRYEMIAGSGPEVLTFCDSDKPVRSVNSFTDCVLHFYVVQEWAPPNALEAAYRTEAALSKRWLEAAEVEVAAAAATTRMEQKGDTGLRFEPFKPDCALIAAVLGTPFAPRAREFGVAVRAMNSLVGAHAPSVGRVMFLVFGERAETRREVTARLTQAICRTVAWAGAKPLRYAIFQEALWCGSGSSVRVAVAEIGGAGGCTKAASGARCTPVDVFDRRFWSEPWSEPEARHASDGFW
jgi:hypothetical protein